MVYFVGAGPGAEDLITIRGATLLGEADVIIYAGSLVNKNLLKNAKDGCKIMNSAEATLEQVIDAMKAAAGKTVVGFIQATRVFTARSASKWTSLTSLE